MSVGCKNPFANILFRSQMIATKLIGCSKKKVTLFQIVKVLRAKNHLSLSCLVLPVEIMVEQPKKKATLGNFFFRTPQQFCRDHLRTEQDIRKRIFASNRQLKTPRPKFFDFLTDVRFTGN